MDISRWVRHRADSSPDRVAVHFAGADITYAALDRRVSRLSAALAGGLQIQQGDRVAYLGYNSPVVLELLFACSRLGAAVRPLELAARRAGASLRPRRRGAEYPLRRTGLLCPREANQYFLRGFNLDHGTDLAITVDGMPVNMPHPRPRTGLCRHQFPDPRAGQRSSSARDPTSPMRATSLPRLAATRLSQPAANEPRRQGTVGSFGYWRGLAAGSTPVGNGHVARRGRGDRL